MNNKGLSVSYIFLIFNILDQRLKIFNLVKLIYDIVYTFYVNKRRL